RIIDVVLPDREIISVLIVRVLGVAETVAAPQDGLFAEAVGEAEARGPVVPIGLPTKVGSISADARQHQRVVGPVIVRETTAKMRSRRRIPLPAQAEIER